VVPPLLKERGTGGEAAKNDEANLLPVKREIKEKSANLELFPVNKELISLRLKICELRTANREPRTVNNFSPDIYQHHGKKFGIWLSLSRKKAPGDDQSFWGFCTSVSVGSQQSAVSGQR
jgi:hypothetical protein